MGRDGHDFVTFVTGPDATFGATTRPDGAIYLVPIWSITASATSRMVSRRSIDVF